jgi:CRISPR/Cas system-associated endonuclease Cas1
MIQRSGYFHAGRVGRGRHDFVLDLMEPLRPIVDRKVLKFVQAHTFHPADFTMRSDGVCRLNPEMARKIIELTETLNLPHVIKLHNQQRECPKDNRHLRF